MTTATPALQLSFSDRVRDFRKFRGETVEGLASAIGINPITLVRWEAGRSQPSQQAAEQLCALGFGNIAPSETKKSSTPRLHLSDSFSSADELRQAVRKKIRTNGTMTLFEPSPYVCNGPENQLPLFEFLYELQDCRLPRIDPAVYKRRLSSVRWAGTLSDTTAQYSLEHLKDGAVHWNANYGSHGWHRYVGRFPAHLVRALLNHFQLNSESLVCDPFCGSGTTLVEARLLGIPAIGFDVCPLSCLISRAKSQFDESGSSISRLLPTFNEYYDDLWRKLETKKSIPELHTATGGIVPRFSNDEKWFSTKAYAGVCIAVKFLSGLRGTQRDLFACALSANMRSIGNVDVDVVRAEYSKTPRANVDVQSLVSRQLTKMQRNILEMALSHRGLLGASSTIRVTETSLLNADLPSGSVDAIVTSPPYGVESLSYLRTHLLSYRSLHGLLKHDPYEFSADIVGSEYLPASVSDKVGELSLPASPQMSKFFSSLGDVSPKYRIRVKMMLQFFDDLYRCAALFRKWLKPNGSVAFVVGNKLIDQKMIPTDGIVTELFVHHGFDLVRSMKHKLKCNNSNSEVPWQERIIQDEFVLIFQKR